jgi:hypothetical protein
MPVLALLLPGSANGTQCGERMPPCNACVLCEVLQNTHCMCVHVPPLCISCWRLFLSVCLVSVCLSFGSVSFLHMLSCAMPAGCAFGLVCFLKLLGRNHNRFWLCSNVLAFSVCGMCCDARNLYIKGHVRITCVSLERLCACTTCQGLSCLQLRVCEQAKPPADGRVCGKSSLMFALGH